MILVLSAGTLLSEIASFFSDNAWMWRIQWFSEQFDSTKPNLKVPMVTLTIALLIYLLLIPLSHYFQKYNEKIIDKSLGKRYLDCVYF